MRKNSVSRKTAETDIQLSLAIDGSGVSKIETGIGFLEHMLALFARHGSFDLEIKAAGDTYVDFHHLTEDIGICLGDAFRSALGDKTGINRYGTAFIPMDETLAMVSVDLSNRPYLVFNAAIPCAKVGDFHTELVEEFMKAFADHGGFTLHVNVLYGKNSHHIIEAIFKALGHAMKMAVSKNVGVEGVLSTKGLL
ncbi:MAG: imidazoleglycerol-phosphate dehydratase HisB [Candidatus Fermentithermobacillus carboniphilus]|uniref:Imidazoleglycerol-phosphate dehydratase n=1 Tax=Candidatus Fermentithermobacillus carboniphilus TaxID=3085328 RepID=A0AAT9L9A4_9FIRM|nr:MAG: imidazoleglycerol-phosphate dehydratase HisB [Candidatus Fermentithermobacillus carboniphilus]